MLSLRKVHLGGTLFVGDATMSIRALDSTNEFELFLDMQRVPLLLLLGGQPGYQDDTFYSRIFRKNMDCQKQAGIYIQLFRAGRFNFHHPDVFNSFCS